MALAMVASIYFAPVSTTRVYAAGPYELPAVPPGADPVLLPITDRLQIEQGPVSLGVNGRRSERQHLVQGEVIARDIVGEWTEHGVGMTPQCRPGIWVVRDRKPIINEETGIAAIGANGVALWRPATEEERLEMWMEDLAAARMADHAYANALFIHASAMAENPKLIPLIPKNARLAAKQYGLTAEWLRENAALHVRPCPYCTHIIPSTAIKCPKCTEVVNVEAYVSLEAQKQVLMKAAKEAQRAGA
jgi:hypothetical protein